MTSGTPTLSEQVKRGHPYLYLQSRTLDLSGQIESAYAKIEKKPQRFSFEGITYVFDGDWIKPCSEVESEPLRCDSFPERKILATSAEEYSTAIYIRQLRMHGRELQRMYSNQQADRRVLLSIYQRLLDQPEFGPYHQAAQDLRSERWETRLDLINEIVKRKARKLSGKEDYWQNLSDEDKIFFIQAGAREFWRELRFPSLISPLRQGFPFFVSAEWYFRFRLARKVFEALAAQYPKDSLLRRVRQAVLEQKLPLLYSDREANLLRVQFGRTWTPSLRESADYP